jgi:hypothetical protein
METANLVELPFFNIYYTAEPLQAKNDLVVLFKDSAGMYNGEIIWNTFLYFTRTARKYGFRLFFIDPDRIFKPNSLEVFNDGYFTPETHIEYKGLPNPNPSEKFN